MNKVVQEPMDFQAGDEFGTPLMSDINVYLLGKEGAEAPRMTRQGIVVLVFSLVYFALIAMLWVNAKWFRDLKITMSPVVLTILWLVIFVGIMVTWIKCLANAEQPGWVQFFFIINMLLLLLVGWAFFIRKNVASAQINMIFLWISTLILCFVAAHYWTPGLIWMLVYLVVVSYGAYMFGRIAATMIARKTNLPLESMLQTVLSTKADAMAAMFDISQGLDGPAPAPAPRPAPVQRPQQPSPVPMQQPYVPDMDRAMPGLASASRKDAAVTANSPSGLARASTPSTTFRSHGF